MKKCRLILILNLGVVFLIAISANAHMLWLTPESNAVSVGESVQIEIGFGHEYPHGKMEKKGMLASVYAVAPDGTEIDAEATSPSTYTFTPEQEGIYRIYSALKPGFVSNTVSGRKLGNKQSLENVVDCFAYRISAVTAIRCGQSEAGEAKRGNPELDIVPVRDPANLGKGDTLALKVLFKGKPLAGASITPAAAAHHHGGGHSHGHGHSHNANVETDSDGIARIKLKSDGWWLFTARHQMPYPDRDKCDSYSYSTSLTIEF